MEQARCRPRVPLALSPSPPARTRPGPRLLRTVLLRGSNPAGAEGSAPPVLAAQRFSTAPRLLRISPLAGARAAACDRRTALPCTRRRTTGRARRGRSRSTGRRVPPAPCGPWSALAARRSSRMSRLSATDRRKSCAAVRVFCGIDATSAALRAGAPRRFTTAQPSPASGAPVPVPPSALSAWSMSFWISSGDGTPCWRPAARARP